MQTMLNVLRYALRRLRRAPGFTLTAVLTLALGIGLNAAIFTVVDCVLLKPLGLRDADRIVGMETHFVEEGRTIPRLGGYDYLDLAAQVEGLEAAAYYNSGSDGIAVRGTAFYLPSALVSPRFGEVLNVQPMAGRLFHPGDRDGADALVGAAFAREHFGSARAALGQGLRVEGALRTIVGVLPDGFSFPDKAQVWLEGAAIPTWSSRTSYSNHVVAKRRAGVSAQQLSAELATFSSRLQKSFVEDRHKSFEAVPLQDQLTGSIRPTLRLLMGSVAVILLIVCANITHLQLVRTQARLRAVTVRAALGASRSALLREALAEALLLAAAGAAGAVLLAIPALKMLLRLAPPDLPRLADIHLNADVLLFSFAASAVLMCATAVLPVWRSWHVEPAAVLKQDAAHGGESRAALRLRNGLLVVEVALTLTLSVAAVLLARQLIAQGHADLGFAPDRLLTLDTHAVVPTAGTAPDTAKEAANLLRLENTLLSVAIVPGVESAAAVSGAPMGFGRTDVRYAVRGRNVFSAVTADRLPNADVFPITPGFLRTMRIPLLRGRALLDTDRADTPPVLLINRELARAVFPGQDPVGRQVMCGYDDHAPAWWTIVGVIGDVREDSPASQAAPAMYIPVAQHARDAADMQVIVRARTDPAALAETLRRELTQAHPELAVQAATMRENIAGSERADRFRTTLFACFAGVSLLLAAVGMYGVTAYSVAQRRFEFALRVAVGASRPQLLGLVLRGAVATAALGIVIGVALSLALGRVLGSVVGALPAFDALSYALAACAVLVLAVSATLFLARTAANVNPMQVLRGE